MLLTHWIRTEICVFVVKYARYFYLGVTDEGLYWIYPGNEFYQLSAYINYTQIHPPFTIIGLLYL